MLKLKFLLKFIAIVLALTEAINAQNCLVFNPLTSICCNGCIVSRIGMRQPACCGRVSFDSVFSLCCNGVVRPKANYALPACCGTSSYDARGLARCCNNSFLASTCSNNNWWWGK